MEFKKEHLGSRVFIKSLAREVEVSEENKLTLIANNLRHLFEMPKPVKTKLEEPKKTEPKKKKNVSTKSTKSESNKHRISSDSDES